MDRTSFIFRREWRDAIRPLPLDVRAEIYEAIIEYAFSEEVPACLSPMASTVFGFVKDKMDYEQDLHRKRSEAGKKGGAPLGNSNAKNKQNKQKTSKIFASELTDNKKVTNFLEDKNNEKTQKKEEIPPYPPNKENTPIPLKENIPPISPKEESLDPIGSLSTRVDSEEEENTRTYKRIVEFYNTAVRGKLMARCVKITEKRKQAIKARINEYGYDGVCEAIRRCCASSFCNGHNDRNWVADFDFVFNTNKMAKILEGKYDDINKKQNDRKNLERDKSDARKVGETALRDIFAEMEERRRTEDVVG